MLPFLNGHVTNLTEIQMHHRIIQEQRKPRFRPLHGKICQIPMFNPERTFFATRKPLTEEKKGIINPPGWVRGVLPITRLDKPKIIEVQSDRPKTIDSKR